MKVREGGRVVKTSVLLATSVNNNGYRHRLLDTRVGTVDVAIPKLHHASAFPDFHRQRVAREVVVRAGI